MTPVLLQPLPKLILLDAHLRGQTLKPTPSGTHPMIGMFEEVLCRARARKSKPDEASALTDLGRAVLQTGDPRGALPYLEAAVPLYREVNDTEREGLTLELVSFCHRTLGDLQRTEEALQQSLRIAEQAGNLELCAGRLLGIGTLHTQLGRPDRASPYYKKGVQLADSLGLDTLLAAGLLRLGQTHSERGQFTDSVPLYRRAVEVYHRLGNAVQEQVARAHLGMDLVLIEHGVPPLQPGQPRKRAARIGLPTLITAGEALIKMEQWLHVPVLADNVGQLLNRNGDRRQAAEWFQRGLDALDRCGGVMTAPTRGALLHRLAMAEQLSGEPARARLHYEQSLPLLLKEGALREHTISQGNLGTLLIEAGRKDEALVHMQGAVKTAATLGDNQILGQSLANLGLTYFHAGRHKEALPILQDALDPLRKGNDAHSLGLVLQALDSLRAVRVVEQEPEPAGPPRLFN